MRSVTTSNGNPPAGTVTLGPDFLHFYIMFALRLGERGVAEGQTVLLTRRRRGFFGFLFNVVLLFLTKIVGNYFAKGDTRVFTTIKFDFKTPIKADRAILSFVQHVEKQRTVPWGLRGVGEAPADDHDDMPTLVRLRAAGGEGP